MATTPDASQYSGSGWRAFAGTLILLAGLFNIVDGLVAVYNSHFVSHHVVFGNLDSWAWAIFGLGVLEVLVSLGIFSGKGFAAFLGVILAALNAVGQLMFIRSYPAWSVFVIALDVLVIYGLTVHGTIRRRA